jgi:hypothetical protein
VVGVIAAAAISIGFFLGNWQMALFGGVAVLAGMIVVREFAGSQSPTSKRKLSIPAHFLIWMGIIAFVAILCIGVLALS